MTAQEIDADAIARSYFTESLQVELARAIFEKNVTRVADLVPLVDVSARGNDGVTFLQWAIISQSLESMKALLDAGADPTQHGLEGNTAIHTASSVLDPAYLAEIIFRGASMRVVNEETRSGPLRSALIADRDQQFHDLLAAGADVNAADRVGNTPLHVAALINEPDRIMDLLNAGADPTVRNTQGVTFQRYMRMPRGASTGTAIRTDLGAVDSWLTERGISQEE